MCIFSRLHELVDWDERLIYPELYEMSPEIYASPPTEVWLVRDLRDGSFDVLYPNKSVPDLSMLGYSFVSTMYKVRVGMPARSKKLRGEMLSAREYRENREKWVVLDSLIVVRHKDFPHSAQYVSYAEYQRGFREFELLDVVFIVRPEKKGV